ncbi:hypothetical protein OPT61_g7040 [Boeremia exigua]|uniref:Uncharacterized protein n=1 Tax=Boeremia exigua TaxID=749465 RepID=A0ACC2I3X8_9PLEO|nr:hypothetical protein OPT61_g7040 [Boeremia exigua]
MTASCRASLSPAALYSLWGGTVSENLEACMHDDATARRVRGASHRAKQHPTDAVRGSIAEPNHKQASDERSLVSMDRHDILTASRTSRAHVLVAKDKGLILRLKEQYSGVVPKCCLFSIIENIERMPSTLLMMMRLAQRHATNGQPVQYVR